MEMMVEFVQTAVVVQCVDEVKLGGGDGEE